MFSVKTENLVAIRFSLMCDSRAMVSELAEFGHSWTKLSAADCRLIQQEAEGSLKREWIVLVAPALPSLC